MYFSIRHFEPPETQVGSDLLVYYFPHFLANVKMLTQKVTKINNDVNKGERFMRNIFAMNLLLSIIRIGLRYTINENCVINLFYDILLVDFFKSNIYSCFN